MMKLTKGTLLLALTFALVFMLALGVINTLAGGVTTGELLTNGGFEGGFTSQGGCGMVGKGWSCFTSGGRGGYGFYDEGWGRAIAAGAHAQMIEINTKSDFGDQNRTAGIYQIVPVAKGETYELTLKGMIRADDLASGGDPWRYVMLVGVSQTGSANWADASWQEVNVGPIQDRLNPSGYYSVKLSVKAQGDKLGVFVAGRMKWGDWNREVDFDIDEVSLKGVKAPAQPTPAPAPTAAPAAPPAAAAPVIRTVTKLVCDGGNMLANGDFEGGFDADGTGKVWLPYNNGGAANYGYYDDTWAPVVAQGKHAQLLEINTRGLSATQADRLIGVSQAVSKLTKGATYQVSLKAMIRESEAHTDEDANRYEVNWGFNDGAAAIASRADLDGWYGIPVSGIGLRTSPGGYSSYSATFTAPGDKLVLYLFGLKKWATLDREVDFDFDDVQLRKCRTVTTTEIVDGGSSGGSTGGVCTYVVVRGDTLSRIATKYHTTVAKLAADNGIKNANRIYVGQPIKVPCSTASAGGAVAVAPAAPSGGAPAPAPAVHIVKRGETLGQIASRYGVTVRAICDLNKIKNPNLIYPKQQLQIPSKP